jgi:hypothetical protein
MSKQELETLFERHHMGYGYYNKNEIIKELLILLNQNKNVKNMLTVKEVLYILDDSDHLDDAKNLIRETIS